MSFFGYLHSESGGISTAHYAVKQFPEGLSEFLRRSKVAYFDESKNLGLEYSTVWDFSGKALDNATLEREGIRLYSDGVRLHWFSQQCYSLGLMVKVFD